MRFLAGALAVLCCALVPTSAQAYKWFLNDDNKAVHWHEFEVPYFIDAGDLISIEPPREDEIIKEAFALWNALDAPFEFVFVDHVSPAKAAPYDAAAEANQNHIVFVSHGWSSLVPFQHENAIALTRLSFNLVDGEIMDADLMLNNQLYHFADCSDGADDTKDYQDLFYVILHEAGHMAGLDHSGDDLSVMFVQHSTCADEAIHHLTPDDTEGFLSFYGTEEFIKLASPPEPGPEFDGAIEGFEEVFEVSDGVGQADGGDGGARSPDCGCRVGVSPALSWGPVLLLLMLLFMLVRRRAH